MVTIKVGTTIYSFLNSTWKKEDGQFLTPDGLGQDDLVRLRVGGRRAALVLRCPFAGGAFAVFVFLFPRGLVIRLGAGAPGIIPGIGQHSRLKRAFI